MAIHAKEGPLKLAETRLENRTNRPHVELCSDLPLEGLIAEVNAIKQAIQRLEDKLDNARFVLFTKLYSTVLHIVEAYFSSTDGTRVPFSENRPDMGRRL